MSFLTNAQLEDYAAKIASMVADTTPDQRNILYSKVAEKLKQHVQGYSARLFEYIADKDRNG